MSSQNKANKPLTHSPLQGCSGRGDVGAGFSVVEYGRGVAVVSTGIVEPLSEPKQCNHINNLTLEFSVFIVTHIRIFQQIFICLLHQLYHIFESTEYFIPSDFKKCKFKHTVYGRI
jgi:hypothetical protein